MSATIDSDANNFFYLLASGVLVAGHVDQITFLAAILPVPALMSIEDPSALFTLGDDHLEQIRLQ